MRALALGCAVGLSACSFLGLADFEVPPCTSHAECEVINVADGIGEDACERWQCSGVPDPMDARRPLSEGQCVLVAPDLDGDGQVDARCAGLDCDDREPRAGDGVAEVCDGVDNDCDGLIDELDDASSEPRPFANVGAPVELGLQGQRARWARGASVPLVASLSSLSDEMGRAIAAQAVESAAPGEAVVHEWDNAVVTPAPRADCPRQTEAGIVSVACDVRDLAWAGVGELAVAFTANTQGCGAGQGRAAAVRVLSPSTFVLQGPTRRSNVWLGVGRTADGRCTENVGVARPRLAPFGGGAEAVLAVWLDRPARDDTCGAPSAVRALGLYPRSANRFDWVDATDGGAPVDVGVAVGPHRPALAPWLDDEVVLAFAAEGGIAIQVFPPPPPPAGPTFFSCDGDACEERAPDSETAFPAPTVQLTLPVGPDGAETVAVSLGGEMDGRRSLGVAWRWRRGCEGPAGIRFRRLFVSGDGRVEPAADEAVDDVLMPDPDLADGPVLAYRPDGFEARPDGGGWMVLWRTRGRQLRGRRVSERTATRLTDDDDWMGPGEALQWPPEVGEGREARVLTIDGALQRVSLTCAP